ncbi:putative glycolipid-binding domain-containing protein [Elioraea sp.]|uniref:putative glycolipid-binding domain-containing protein n=1 Tax=Elioraea sp. TaxID=2185103 RepID=UPI003F71834A
MSDERRVVWRRHDAPTLETCVVHPDRREAEGVVAGMIGGEAIALRWRVGWDEAWHTRRAQIERLERHGTEVMIASDRQGVWHDGAGRHLEALDGCLDVDIGATPFTNTLAIRRLALTVGGAADITVAYVAVPALTVAAAAQRYTRLAEDRYRYEGLFRSFTGELLVDAEGLVRVYEGTFTRVEGA